MNPQEQYSEQFLQDSGATEQHKTKLAKYGPLTATLARLALVPPAVNAILDGNVAQTSLLMGGIIAADYLDGVFARSVGADGDNPARRIADGVVDRVTTWSCIGALFFSKSEIALWYAPIIVTSLSQLALNSINYKNKNTVLVGTGWHKTALMSQVFLAGSVLADAPTEVTTGFALLSYGLSFAHFLSFLGASKTTEKQSQKNVKKVEAAEGLKMLFSRKIYNAD